VSGFDLVSDAPDQLESRADHGPLSYNGSTDARNRTALISWWRAPHSARRLISRLLVATWADPRPAHAPHDGSCWSAQSPPYLHRRPRSERHLWIARLDAVDA